MGWGHVASDLCEAQGASGPASKWAVVAEDVCLSQESSDSLMEEADALCENSDDDTLLIPEPRPGYAEKTWWARQLEQHALALGYKVSYDSAKPLQLVSCCSGACTEATALKDFSYSEQLIIQSLSLLLFCAFGSGIRRLLDSESPSGTDPAGRKVSLLD